jgi:hypothetical protein
MEISTGFLKTSKRAFIMKKRIFQIIPLLVVWAMIIACGIPNPLTPSATQTPYVITTTPQSAGVENTAAATEPDELLPTAEVSQPTAGEVQTQSPVSAAQVPNGPAGILVSEGVEGIVGVYDSYGNKVGDVNVPGFSAYGPGKIFAYGFDPNNITTLETFYYTNDTHMLKKAANGQTSDLVSIEFFANMAAYAASPYFLAGRGTFADGGLATEMLAYKHIDNTQSRYFADTISADSHVFAPMYIMGTNGLPTSAYYTKEAYGIGGDIIYPVTYGLYHMDLASGNTNWLFNDDYRPLSISPDGSMAAIVARSASSEQGVSVYDLSGPSEIVTYDLLMGQDRGAGYGFISPDNQKIVFMQAGGYMMSETPDFRSQFCYADIAPGAQANCLSAKDIVVSTVAYPNYWAQPLGWLNNHEVLYSAYTMQEPQRMLRIFDVNNGSVRDFASGNFLGFIY